MPKDNMSAEAKFTPRLSNKYLAQEGWVLPDSQRNELFLLGNGIAQGIGVDSTWIRLRKEGPHHPTSGPIQAFTVSFLYNLRTNHPLVEVNQKSLGEKHSYFVPDPNPENEELTDPLKIVKLETSEQPELIALGPLAQRTVDTRALLAKSAKSNPFVHQDDLMNFFDPNLMTDMHRREGAYEVIGIPQPEPQFDDDRVTPLNPLEINNRYFLLPDATIKFPSESRPGHPSITTIPGMTRVNRNYLEVAVHLAELQPEIQARLEGVQQRYAERVHDLISTIASKSAELQRLAGILVNITPETTLSHIHTLEALFAQLDTYPDLFPEGDQPQRGIIPAKLR